MEISLQHINIRQPDRGNQDFSFLQRFSNLESKIIDLAPSVNILSIVDPITNWPLIKSLTIKFDPQLPSIQETDLENVQSFPNIHKLVMNRAVEIGFLQATFTQLESLNIEEMTAGVTLNVLILISVCLAEKILRVAMILVLAL